MRHICHYLPIILFLQLSRFLCFAEEDNCSEVISRGLELFMRGEISDALAPLALDSPNTICVHRTSSTSEAFCRGTTRPLNQVEPPPNEDWNGIDFKEELFQLILSDGNYSSCASIFETDEPLRSAIESVELLNPKEIEYYVLRSRFKRTYGPLEDEPMQAQVFSNVRQRLIRVFEAMDEWAYCSGSKIGPTIDGKFGKTLAYLDRHSMKIIMYHGACTTQQLYDLDISYVTATHRAFLVAAHEVGHVIDLLSGVCRLPKQSEAYATYYGTLFAECAARRFVRLGAFYRDMVQKLYIATDMDKRYIYCQTRYWEFMERFFSEVRARINLSDGTVPENIRAIMWEIQELN